MSVNYFGAVELAEQLGDSLAAGQYGRVVAISSIALKEPITSYDLVDLCLRGEEAAAREWLREHPFILGQAYCSSKYALAKWIRLTVSSDRWLGRGISVIGIAPRIVRTPMTESLLKDPVMRAQMMELVPMPIGSIAEADDIAALLEFLLTPSARFTAGQIIFVDGGSEAFVRSERFL